VVSLLDALRANLQANALSYTTASAVHDVYEGYLFSLVVTAAAQSGASVSYRTVDGRPSSSLVFRTSPGRLYSRTRPYTHAVLGFGRTPELEVHLGVRVQGSSGVLHECDVVVLESAEAAQSRRNNADPRSSKCLLAVECKYYATPLPLGMARGFVGLHADLRMHTAAFVANVGSPTVDRYLNSRRQGYEFEVLPGTPHAGHFQSLIRSAFKAHTSKYDPGYPI
jgi:hypothetical protein